MAFKVTSSNTTSTSSSTKPTVDFDALRLGESFG